MSVAGRTDVVKLDWLLSAAGDQPGDLLQWFYVFIGTLVYTMALVSDYYMNLI